MAKIKFALVGCGFIGQVHAANLAAHPATALTLTADIDEARARQLAQRYGSRTATVEQAIRHEEIDAVLIASATPSHAALLEAAARAGKAVWCEKPIDLSLARAQQTVERILPLKAPVTVGFNRRFDQSHRQLKRQLAAGAIGQPELIQMVCRSSEMPSLDYLRASGGQMRDQAIHFFDLLRWLTGDEVTLVGALGATLAQPALSELGDVDTSVLIMQLQQGALAQLDNARRTGYGYDERISVMGAAGLAESASPLPPGVRLWQGDAQRQPGMWPDWFSRIRATWYDHLDAFVSEIQGVPSADLPRLLDGLQAQAIAEAATLALQTRRFCAVAQLTGGAA
ncbi:Gfo/Idh/MocA family oxidoreductase [Mixta gaviniae]|uniref:Oxidoreductase n=1 Tax=Mixta gaviniae TaxID=665914 RepID=A0A2L0IF89_9GAMM|nr:Gfo/Idh/MocA family oxidoreductase [Mixta gaviniae]AUX93159.1 oxidoreductase [Mixta gaviniae]